MSTSRSAWHTNRVVGSCGPCRLGAQALNQPDHTLIASEASQINAVKFRRSPAHFVYCYEISRLLYGLSGLVYDDLRQTAVLMACERCGRQRLPVSAGALVKQILDSSLREDDFFSWHYSEQVSYKKRLLDTKYEGHALYKT